METQSFLNSLDAIVIGVVFLSAFLALMRGFVREMFSLVAWIGAYFIGTTFYGPVVPWMQDYIKSERMAEWVAIGIVFIIALVLLSVLGHVVCGFVRGSMATKINRSLGFAYGLARGMLVVCLVYLGAILIFWPNIDSSSIFDTDEEPPKVLMEARTRPLMAYGAKLLVKLIPENIIEDPWASVDESREELKDALRANDLDDIKENYSDMREEYLENDDDVTEDVVGVEAIFNDEGESPVNVHELFKQGDE